MSRLGLHATPETQRQTNCHYRHLGLSISELQGTPTNGQSLNKEYYVLQPGVRGAESNLCSKSGLSRRLTAESVRACR